MGKTTKDVHLISHENMYPQWYVPATTIRTDETGTKSYFTENSKYLKDGWAGSTKTKTDHGEYIKNFQTGERYLYHPHSKLSNEHYENLNESTKLKGLLPNYIFAYPVATDFSNLRSEGFKLLEEGNIIKVSGNNLNIVWDITAKILIRQKLDGDHLIKTTKTYFKYNEELKAYLIQKTVTIKPGTFSNGNYFETIKTSVYSNYNTTCLPKKVSSKVSRIDVLELLPNPTANVITIKMPKYNTKANIKICNLTGAVLVERNIDSNLDQYSINVNDLPTGIYVVKLEQGVHNYSSKFVKQ